MSRLLYVGPVSVLCRRGQKALTLVPGRVYDLPDDAPRIRGLIVRGYFKAAPEKLARAETKPARAETKPAARAAPSPPANETPGRVNTDPAVTNNTKTSRSRKDSE